MRALQNAAFEIVVALVLLLGAMPTTRIDHGPRLLPRMDGNALWLSHRPGQGLPKARP
jgi:hypothetical protein